MAPMVSGLGSIGSVNCSSATSQCRISGGVTGPCRKSDVGSFRQGGAYSRGVVLVVSSGGVRALGYVCLVDHDVDLVDGSGAGSDAGAGHGRR